MDSASLIMGIVIGGLVGIVITWLLVRSQSISTRVNLSRAEEELKGTREELNRQNERVAEQRETIARMQETLRQEQKAAEEKLAVLTQATEELSNAFKALSAEALKSNNQLFLDLAKSTLEKFQTEAKSDLEQRQKAVENLVKPVRESLDKVDMQIQELEKARQEAYGSLRTQVRSLVETQEKLHKETGNLVKALRTPHVRGRWGEIQLKRVVEIAGMLPYCDFVDQSTITTEEGRLRPDLIVNLPGGKQVVVDAKAPLEAYLDALEREDEESKRERLKVHARQIRDHMSKLSSKAYWDQFEASPEFVVMFLPGETFFSVALEHEPGLIEEGVNQRVIPASPTTLIALLRAVAYGWRQEKIAQSAQEISDLGKELYSRLRVLGEHFQNVGKNLDRAVDAYNKAVGSFESRVLVSARKFTELGTPAREEISELGPVERQARLLQPPERIESEGSEGEGKK